MLCWIFGKKESLSCESHLAETNYRMLSFWMASSAFLGAVLAQSPTPHPQVGCAHMFMKTFVLGVKEGQAVRVEANVLDEEPLCQPLPVSTTMTTGRL